MKNKNCIIVSMLIIAFLFAFVTGVKASDQRPPLEIVNNTQDGGTTENTEQPNTAAPVNNTVTPTTGNTTGNTPANTTKTNSLPDTGVAEDTALFVFITICVVSAVYALVKVRNYKNI